MQLKLNELYCYYTALIGYLGLFLLLMLWITLLAPPAKIPVALILIIVVTPLLLPLRGFLHGNKRSCTWSAYISLIYFIHGTTEAFVNSAERLYAVLEIIFSLMLFMGSVYYIRLAGSKTQ